MKKVHVKELQARLLGTLTDHPDTLQWLSTDASIFSVLPTAVVYPQNTADVRKVVQYAAERAETGKPLSIVARGLGSSTTGASLDEGLVLAMPAHMHKLLRLDAHTVTVQPGINLAALQQVLHTHNRWLPGLPDDAATATIGGSVATNAAGARSLKYGPLRRAVKSLKVVLSDGSLIKTERLSARELNRKKGHATLEGEIYRQIDSLLLDHPGLIKKHTPHVARNASGYALSEIRHPDGSFDLSQLFIGSEGTLGIITEITLATAPHNPRTTLVVGYFDSVERAAAAITKLRALAPSALELIDAATLEHIREHRPADLEGLVPEKLPKIVLFAEFDDFSQVSQKFRTVRAQRILARNKAASRVATDPVEQVALWKLRWTAGNRQTTSARQPLPFINDAVVPVDKLPQLIEKAAKLLTKYDLESPIYGHAGDANLTLAPALDLSRKRDVDKLFNLLREYAELVVSLGGSPTGSHGDGLLHAPHLAKLYGTEIAELYDAVKRACDPKSIFAPNHKTGATEAYARAHLRTEYSRARFADYPNQS